MSQTSWWHSKPGHLRGNAFLRLFLLLSLLMGIGSQAVAQGTEPAHKTPKIALVLSGGGALGLAHVGVIQELERMNLRPDFVVGTSMGSIVGGLYASGLDGAALERVVNEMNWAEIFNPTPERRNLTYRQKTQDADFPVKASLALDGANLILPAGAISDQKLLQQLRYFSAAKGVLKSFNDLPIPFRAVATDIETGKAVVIDHGELPMAMRASMSVPGVFSPITMDGKLLVDGGMAANIPISIARDMGADIVIVVATPSALQDRQKIASALDVLGQSVTLLILSNERAQLATLTPNDVLIMIDPGDINAAAFDRGKDLITAGRKSLMAKTADLNRLLANRPLRPKTLATAPPTTQIDYIRIQNGSRLADEVIKQKVDDLVGKPADPETINLALDRVFALGQFDRVDYVLERTKEGAGLVVRAENRAPSAGRIRLGLTVANDFRSVSDYTLSFDYRTPALDNYGSELQLQATIGDRSAASAELFKLLEPSQSWFLTGKVKTELRPIGVYSGKGYKLGNYDLTYALASAGAGYQFGGTGELRLEVQRGVGRARASEGTFDAQALKINIGRVRLQGNYESLDNAYFPRTGSKATFNWTQGMKGLGDSNAFQNISGSALTTRTRGDDTLVAAISGGTNLSGTTPADARYRLGGLFSLSGYYLEELSGESFTLGQLVYRHAIDHPILNILGSQLFVGGTVEVGQVWTRRSDVDFSKLQHGGSIYVGADTPLGPMFLAYGQSDRSRRSVYLFIGRPF